MKIKLYFGALFLMLIYFGTFQEQVSRTNQEIVLEFVDTKINKQEISSTITNIKERLLKVGVSNIKIQETQKGTLKISYYSFVHTSDIKEALVFDNQLALNKNSEKKGDKNDTSTYNIDVYEITNQTNISDQNDEYIFEIKVNSDRFTTNYNYVSTRNIDAHKVNQLYTTAYNTYKNHPFTKDYSSHQEPEVRAGPHKNFL
ncbi:hypothetical protein H9W90_09110 [Polaribacter pectinis]|uniref:Uncharacterized protein n=1 Tax=Polaribacter pectinis TaxID=2738844 RepID=A0A7G9L6W7_9FLAO|nr:hypothetical protein [Polaribacter pectinis]QNM84366.1 hypothetical protein H9W90_09110 [Polaribacter pectinis]